MFFLLRAILTYPSKPQRVPQLKQTAIKALIITDINFINKYTYVAPNLVTTIQGALLVLSFTLTNLILLILRNLFIFCIYTCIHIYVTRSASDYILYRFMALCKCSYYIVNVSYMLCSVTKCVTKIISTLSMCYINRLRNYNKIQI